ncbi:Pentatricopeptide repeat-containing protein [Drosera capensis]
MRLKHRSLALKLPTPKLTHHSFPSPQPLGSPSPSPSPLNPLYNLLPDPENPAKLVNLISSSFTQNPAKTPSQKGTEMGLLPPPHHHQHLIPHLGTPQISRILLRLQSDPLGALNFFNWVRDDVGLSPSVRNYCVIVHILVWGGEFKDGMRLLNELIELCSDKVEVFEGYVRCLEECNGNKVVFDMLIKAYVRAGRVRDGYWAFREAVREGMKPSVVAVNCLLNGMGRMGCVEECWEVYGVMGRIGIVPNGVTFNVLTNLVCKGGDVDREESGS